MQAPHPASPDAAVDGFVRLPDWGVIRARGDEAASFLQGQLTQDVASLDSKHAALAGYCSAKGRLLASFVVWRPAADEVLLACSADLLPATLKRLSMFVLRARCKLSDASAELAVHGLVGRGAPAAWHRTELAGGSAIGLPAVEGVARALWVTPPTATMTAWPAFDAAAWAALEVASSVPRIVAATAEQFVPQMINFDLVGGVNFQKGCYPGQEVVARSQYRGTLKRRAALFECGASAQAGQEVFHSNDPAQPAGMVVLAAPRGDKHLVLAEVKLAALEHGSLHLGSAQGAPLRRQALPYALPIDA